MYGRGWIKMGAGASFFFKNAGPVFKWFILLISISLTRELRHDYKKLHNYPSCKFLSSAARSSPRTARWTWQWCRSLCSGGRTQTTAATHTFLIELLRQARVLVSKSRTHSHVRGEDSDGHSMIIAMECAAVGTMMLLIMSIGTMYVSYFICMATTILSGMAHLKHRLRLGTHGKNFIHLHFCTASADSLIL